MNLVMISVKTGDKLDVISLRNSKLEYRTGAAKSIFDGTRRQKPQSDTALFQVMSDWSNGYIKITREES